MSGKHIDLFGWHFFVNCHWPRERGTYPYRRYPSSGCGPDVRVIVIVGLELAWWRSA